MTKKCLFRLLFVCAVLFCFAQQKANAQGPSKAKKQSAVPSLDELEGDWMNVNTLRNYPSVMNFIGGLQTTENITAFKSLTLPPFALGGLSCQLLLDGKPLAATHSLWNPTEVRRKVTADGIAFASYIRMQMEQKSVMIKLVVRNTLSKTKTVNLTMTDFGHVRYYPPEEWRTWGNKRPGDKKYTIVQDKNLLSVKDNKSEAVAVYAFNQVPNKVQVLKDAANVHWSVRLSPGETVVIEMVSQVGNNESVAKNAQKVVSAFGAQFQKCKTDWENRWQASFTRGNKFFSGQYPILETDDAKIRRVYYHGALVPLLLCRTNLPYSPRMYVTAGPEWANTLNYFWDTEMWANTWAMLDPESMRDNIKKWFWVNIHGFYAVEGFTGKGAGPWYAANDWSIFRCIEAYLGVTGDYDFLNTVANGKTILEQLYTLATFYKTRPLTQNTLLANYGGPENLLECSPSYIQGVPSLNAANIYMLRKTAAYYQKFGNVEKAAGLRSDAEKLLPYVMNLYEKGDGVWSAIDTSGKKVPIRHCYDYITIGQALEHDLSPQTKREMDHFVESELLTKTWMRAMSFKDPAAKDSDRPDHGPMGSYDGWPPMTMDVLCRFGDFQKAVDFLRATESITRQGSWAQAHEFVGPDKMGFDPIVRVANRGGQDANEGCGAAFAEVIIRAFFGYRPDRSTDKLELLSPNIPRGFNGKLKNLRWKDHFYTIVSDQKGLHLIKE